ncbi:CLUMA_CG013473, isoform A [Clunio marinus]|uniref:CLUMA_CG013473, isoform A n=1 Tax=Clunio marinus TaxID=568069 RepID=A0A1J1IIX9_9DIPT|nr:CLUMA_CG013473, isoform A [Clunio marinus]
MFRHILQFLSKEKSIYRKLRQKFAFDAHSLENKNILWVETLFHEILSVVLAKAGSQVLYQQQ